MGSSTYIRRYVLAGITALGVLAHPLAAQTAQTAPTAPVCATDRVLIKGAFGQAAFNVDLAADDASRAQGLMHVEQMPLSKGMLFVYDKAEPLSFWMRNTLIELDMLFVDGAGVVQHIHHRAQPLDETPISPGAIALNGVLEINGGLAERLGLGVGDVLYHPAFTSDDPEWACGRSN
ncbi:MAG: DUF192 domain-containing protein [Sulfitobacter sp.]